MHFHVTVNINIMQSLLKKNEMKPARSFNFTFRYKDDIISLNNFKLGDFVDRIYPMELEIKDSTDAARSASFLDIHLKIDRCRPARNETLRQKR